MSLSPRVREFAAIVSLACVPALAGAVGSTPVTIVNPADIAKAEGIQQPFAASIGCDATGGFGIRCSGSTTVPAGQRWVIEYVSANCKIDNGRQLLSQASLTTRIGGTSMPHYLSIRDHAGAVGDFGSAINVVQLGEAVRLYADAGSTVSFSVGTSGATPFTGYPFCDARLSGQAVTVP